MLLHDVQQLGVLVHHLKVVIYARPSPCPLCADLDVVHHAPPQESDVQFGTRVHQTQLAEHKIQGLWVRLVGFLGNYGLRATVLVNDLNFTRDVILHRFCDDKFHLPIAHTLDNRYCF